MPPLTHEHRSAEAQRKDLNFTLTPPVPAVRPWAGPFHLRPCKWLSYRSPVAVRMGQIGPDICFCHSVEGQDTWTECSRKTKLENKEARRPGGQAQGPISSHKAGLPPQPTRAAPRYLSPRPEASSPGELFSREVTAGLPSRTPPPGPPWVGVRSGGTKGRSRVYWQLCLWGEEAG